MDGVKDSIEEMINNGEVSDDTQKNLDKTYNITSESDKRIIEAYKAALGESRGNVFIDDVLEDIDQYKPNDIDSTSAGKIETATSKILTVISNIGIAVSVIMLAILGIKYMIGSVEEKAEYKQGLVPYVIGAFILFGITSFVKILMVLGNKIASI